MAEIQNPQLACKYQLEIPKGDPSHNVSQAIEASVIRLNDLRESDRDHDDKIHTLESKRLDDLRAAESRRIDEQADMRAEHAKEINKKEINRLDSIRQVDMTNANTKAESLALAIQTLNSTGVANADNLRNALTATATAMAKTTSELATTIATQQSIRDENTNKRITALEQSSYVGQGKEKVTDPLLAGYMADIKDLLGKKSEGLGMKELWGYIAGAIGLLILLLKAFNVI